MNPGDPCLIGLAYGGRNGVHNGAMSSGVDVATREKAKFATTTRQCVGGEALEDSVGGAGDNAVRGRVVSRRIQPQQRLFYYTAARQTTSWRMR